MALEATSRSLKLPLSLTGPVDVAHLGRELELIDSSYQQAELRHTKLADPATSPLLAELLELNQLSLVQSADRALASQFLVWLTKTAPDVHISFASNPSANFTKKLLTWLRTNISPFLLVSVGLEPAIAAGCVIRTTNKSFDLSLRQRFQDSRHLIVEALRQTIEDHNP